MFWQITVQGALFFLSIIIFGIIGYRRGWQRETVSLLFIIVGLVFLYLSGGAYISRLLYQFLEGRSISDANLQQSHPNVLPVVTFASLVVIIAIGYFVSGKMLPKQKSGQDRVLGLIPGIMEGAAVAAGLTYYFLPSSGKSVITTGTIQMNLNFLGNLTVLLIFVIAVVVVVIGLMATRPKKSSGGGGGEKK